MKKFFFFFIALIGCLTISCTSRKVSDKPILDNIFGVKLSQEISLNDAEEVIESKLGFWLIGNDYPLDNSDIRILEPTNDYLIDFMNLKWSLIVIQTSKASQVASVKFSRSFSNLNDASARHRSICEQLNQRYGQANNPPVKKGKNEPIMVSFWTDNVNSVGSAIYENQMSDGTIEYENELYFSNINLSDSIYGTKSR